MTLRQAVLLGVVLALFGAGFGLGQLRQSGTPGVYYDEKDRKVDANGRVFNESGNPTIRTRFKGELDVSGRIHTFNLQEENAHCFLLDRGAETWSISCFKYN